ncbi:MAG: hypothetical protein JNL97_08645, partial [Verrucomicrobiales bacterium]|nr:hypothetical protein [Verrucomicrobiales bacterium]
MNSSLIDGTGIAARADRSFVRLPVVIAALVACLIQAGTSSSQASPIGVQLSAPAIDLPATYLLESDPTRAALNVRVGTTVTRNQLCPSGNLLLPCPAVPTSIRITVSLGGLGLRPRATAQKVVVYDVAGNANFPIQETLALDPAEVLSDDTEQQISVILEHVEDPALGTYVKDDSGIFGPYRFGHFSGLLRFGAVDVSLGGITGNPVWLGKGRWQLEVGSGQASNGRPVAHTVAVPPLVLAQRDDHGVLTVMTGAVEVLGAKG